RMLAIVEPSKLPAVQEICGRWGIPSAVIGSLVPGGRVEVTMNGKTIADVPAGSLAVEGPVYERPTARPSVREEDPTFLPFDGDLFDALLAVLASPNVASKRWVFEQYDRFVQGQ